MSVKFEERNGLVNQHKCPQLVRMEGNRMPCVSSALQTGPGNHRHQAALANWKAETYDTLHILILSWQPQTVTGTGPSLPHSAGIILTVGPSARGSVNFILLCVCLRTLKCWMLVKAYFNKLRMTLYIKKVLYFIYLNQSCVCFSTVQTLDLLTARTISMAGSSRTPSDQGSKGTS